MQASIGRPDPESVAGCPVARGWFYSKTSGCSINFGLFACETFGFSTISVARYIKPMLYERFRLPDVYNQCVLNMYLDRVYKTNACSIRLLTEFIKPIFVKHMCLDRVYNTNVF